MKNLNPEIVRIDDADPPGNNRVFTREPTSRRSDMTQATDQTGGIITKVLLYGLAGLVLIGVAGNATGSGGESDRAGSGAVYTEIAAETSCAALQGTFDRADATAQRPGSSMGGERWSAIGAGYMDAAHRRMEQIGCYS